MTPFTPYGRENAPSTALPRVTLASVLIPPIRSAVAAVDELVASNISSDSSSSGSKSNGSRVKANSKAKSNAKGSKSRKQSGAESESKSVLKRLLAKCTVKEPTYDEVLLSFFLSAGANRLACAGPRQNKWHQRRWFCLLVFAYVLGR